jgi:hypothetical protein
MSAGLHVREARKKIVAAQPSGFGEFGGGAFGLAFERISRGESATNERYCRHGAARFFEPDDRVVGVRLQQTYSPNQDVPPGDVGIAGIEANGLLRERDHLVYKPGVESASAETV